VGEAALAIVASYENSSGPPWMTRVRVGPTERLQPWGSHAREWMPARGVVTEGDGDADVAGNYLVEGNLDVQQAGGEIHGVGYTLRDLHRRRGRGNYLG